MPKITSGELDDILSGKKPLVDSEGNVLSPAKTNVFSTPSTLFGSETILRDRSGRPIGGGSIIGNPNPNKDVESARIGDYVYDAFGNASVVPNSYRDLANKYVIRIGEAPVQGLNFYDYMSAVSKGISGGMGLPTDSSNVGTMLGTAAIGALAKSIPGASYAWAGMNALGSIFESGVAYADKYASQEIEYDIGFDIETDENGNTYITPKREKQSEAGRGSGPEVMKAVDTENTGAEMLGDNKLNFNVSEAFAQSQEYKKFLEDISETLSSLTVDQANSVVDEDTGTTFLESISKDLQAAESMYYYNAKSVKEFKEIAPAASDGSIAEASYTQLAGYINQDNLDKMAITIYNDANEKIEINAKAWADEIKNKSKQERNTYMNKIASRIQSPDISDDEKVVLQAQANVLYALSDSDGAYKGMYKKGFLDSLGDCAVPIFSQISWNDVGKSFGAYGTLDAFERNDFYAGTLQVANTIVSAKAMSKVMDLAEKGLRGVTQAAGDGILKGTKLGEKLAKVNEYAPQDTMFRYSKLNASSSTPLPNVEVIDSAKSYLGKTAVQTSMQVLADATVDALKGVTYKALGYEDRFNYLDELRTDILFDALMSYGPRNYVERANRPKIKALDDYEKIKEVDENGDPTGETFILPTTKLVEKTSGELAAKHAKTIDRLTDSDVALKTQELFNDQNAAMGKMAIQIRRLVGEDSYLYRKMVRFSGDIKQLSMDMRTLFNQAYKTEWDDFKKTFREVAPKWKDWTKADRNYFNAVVNHHRFSAEHAGDKAAQKEVDDFYKEALNGVSEERKAELNKLIESGRKLAARVFDYYEDMGILSHADVKKMRNTAAYKGGMFFPVWQKNHKVSGGEIAQARAGIKKIWDKAELIDVKAMEDPLVTLTQYIGNATRNVAVNERAKLIRDVGSVPGMRIHVHSDTGGSLKDVENLKELNEKFAKEYDKLAEETRKEYPTREEWRKQNDGFVLRSKALKVTKELSKLREDGADLRRALRRAQYAFKKAPTDENAQKVEDVRLMLADNREAQKYTIDRIKDYSKMVMKRAQKVSKSEVKLDINTYVDVQLTAKIKRALDSNNPEGRLQSVLSQAVNAANPFIDVETVIQRRAEDRAEKFRKDMNKNLKIQENKRKKMPFHKVQELADSAMDDIEEKVMGEQAEIKVINDSEASRILSKSGDPHTIRYLQDGKVQTMTLTGKGSERVVAEFYAPEQWWVPKTMAGRMVNGALSAMAWVARTKRVMTSAIDPGRFLPNLARDWTRGVVTTGGTILLSPEMLRDWAISLSDGSEESIKMINDAFNLANDAIDRDTFTASQEVPKKNRSKAMSRAMNEPDGNAFTRFIYDKFESPTKFFSALQDFGETYTRKHAMDTAYYMELGSCLTKGMSMDQSIKRATEAAYFYGREATTNFFRRGKLVAEVARFVPYLSQNFSTLESFKYAFLDNPVAVTRTLQTTILTYASLIAIALSNEESRNRYYLLSEYDRANNIIIPLTNDTIITIPLDETMAAFLTPYRRTIETLNGVDPASFYGIFAETLEALSPFDLSGFSEGDKFNLVRGLERLGAQWLPTWAQPIIESWTGRDLYYGTTIRVTDEDVGQRTDNWTPTPGELTTAGKNSQTLKTIANATGIPQWILQNTYNEYGGSVGQYVLNTIDKLAGATEEAQGGKEWSDSIFKPFTGADSDQVNNAFWDGINQLKNEKAHLQKELKTIKADITAASGEAKSELEDKRQKKIREYGTKVSDFVNQYLSAYDITGGLSRQQANQIWYLYVLYDQDGNADMYAPGSTGEYYEGSGKLSSYNQNRAEYLAAVSGIDKYINPNVAKADTLAKNVYDPNANYAETYGQAAFKNSVYGDATRNVYRIEKALKDADLFYGNKMYDGYDEAKAAGKKALKQYKSDWNTKVLLAIAPTVDEVGLDTIIGSSQVMDFLDNYLFDVTVFNRKEYIKKVFGGQ